MIADIFFSALYVFALAIVSLFSWLPDATLPGDVSTFLDFLSGVVSGFSPLFPVVEVFVAVSFFVLVFTVVIFIKFLTWARNLLPF